MILKEATKEAFGYYPSNIKPKARKLIITMCTLCGEIRIVEKFNYHILCLSCAQKGKHHTVVTKSKIRVAHTGKNNPNFGKSPSEKTRAKLSKALKGEKSYMFGKSPSEGARALLSAAKKGEKNPNWQDCISFEPYCIKFNEAYKKIVRDKFNNRCFWCGLSEAENGRALSVHHVNYNKNCGCDKTKCICVPLCTRCHARTNRDRDEWEKKLLAKIQLLDEEEVRRED